MAYRVDTFLLIFAVFMEKRGFSQLSDKRLIKRGNKILDDLFSKSIHSIRQITNNESDAKAFYRFLQNERVDENTIIQNMLFNCRTACSGKVVLCIQDSTEINLSSHKGRIKKDDYIGTTNANRDIGLGFFLHPSLVVDAQTGTPYGFADVRVWNRELDFTPRNERKKQHLPIEDKESYKWIDVSKKTQDALCDTVEGMVIIQDREGDIYEQFATIPNAQTALLIRARIDRRLSDGTKLYDTVSKEPCQGNYTIEIPAKGNRKYRKADIEVRFKEVVITRPEKLYGELQKQLSLYIIEAKEVNNTTGEAVCWRLLTTIPVTNIDMAKTCIEWYSWRWMIEEFFKLLKKEGYNIEASELEYASSIRKMCLLILETSIKLFLMRLAYAEPETDLMPELCFSEEEQELLEHQITKLEGKTEKQKNPYLNKELKRYVWVLARLGGWKGYESNRHPGITTLWNGLQRFKSMFEGWQLFRDVSTR